MRHSLELIRRTRLFTNDRATGSLFGTRKNENFCASPRDTHRRACRSFVSFL